MQKVLASTRGTGHKAISAGGQGVLEARGTQVMKTTLTVQSSGEAVHSLVPAGNVGLQLNDNGLCLIFTRTASGRYDYYFLHFMLRGKSVWRDQSTFQKGTRGPWEGRQGLKLESLNGVTTDPHGLHGGSAPGHREGNPGPCVPCCPQARLSFRTSLGSLCQQMHEAGQKVRLSFFL